MKCFLKILLLLFIVNNSLFSQQNTRQLTYDSFAAKNFSLWPELIEKQEKKIMNDSGSCIEILETMKDYYGYIGHLLDINDKKNADIWCKKAKKFFSKVSKPYLNDADFIAYNSLLTAFEIAISPYKAPLLAPSMFLNARKSINLNPNSAVSNLSYGNFLYFFPEALGGDKNKALEHYTKVFQYFEENKDVADNDWRYLYIISTLGVVNERLGNLSVARDWLNYALSICPEYAYVIEVLIPRLNSYN